MTIKETIAANLKRLRKEKGWTMRKVAAMVFIRHSAYQKYEEAKSEPSIETLMRLCKIYKTTFEEITTNSVQAPA
jgi:transcriptional regulator with XRE-family HTH domain